MPGSRVLLVDHDVDDEIQKLGIQPFIINTIMKTAQERKKLAQDVLHFIMRIIE